MGCFWTFFDFSRKSARSRANWEHPRPGPYLPQPSQAYRNPLSRYSDLTPFRERTIFTSNGSSGKSRFISLEQRERELVTARLEAVRRAGNQHARLEEVLRRRCFEEDQVSPDYWPCRQMGDAIRCRYPPLQIPGCVGYPREAQKSGRCGQRE